MADNNTNAADAAAAGNGANENLPQAGILAQYVKDLSFENPGAPQSLQEFGKEQPKIDISVNVNAARVGEEGYEVALNISAAAKNEDKQRFLVELVYAGLFGIRNLPEESLEAFLLIECPRILFPFARRIVADVTRDGGFPPLLLEPIDFGTLYQKHMEAKKAGEPAGDTA
ncbi:MAG: protein-export chaperone SecB [Sphingomonadales bacterium]